MRRTTRNHGWASGCVYLMSGYILGVRPYEYGWKKIIFDPQPGTLKTFKGVVPSELGDIAVKYSDGKFTLVIPKDIEVESVVENVEIIRY